MINRFINWVIFLLILLLADCCLDSHLLFGIVGSRATAGYNLLPEIFMRVIRTLVLHLRDNWVDNRYRLYTVRLLSLYLFNISVILLRFFLILNCNACLFLYLFLLFFRNLVNINFYAIVIGVFICVQHVTVSIKVIILMFWVR